MRKCHILLFANILFFGGIIFFASFSRANASDITQTPIPETYFGMHWWSTFNGQPSPSFPWPSVPFGTLRIWDTGVNTDMTDASHDNFLEGAQWPDINTARGVYDWTALDKYLDYAEAHNVEVIYVLGRTPQWAVSGSCTGQWANFGPVGGCAEPPDSLTDWDNWVTAVATHTAGRIKYWEIWNEFNLPEFWTASQATLVNMHQRAYNIIKGIDPTAKITTPSVTGYGSAPATALQNYLNAVGANYVDIVNYHGYVNSAGGLNMEPAENLPTQIALYKTAMSNAGMSAKPLWSTEGSWGDILPVTSTEAAYLARKYLLEWSVGVERSIWYAWANVSWGQLLGSGLTPNVAGIAYGQVNNWMVGATMSTPCALASGVWSCGFTRPNGYQAQAVWVASGTKAYTIPSQFTQYRNLSGTITVLGNRNITLGISPILMELPAGVADTTPPSTPTNLSATLSGSQINLTWTASTDNVSVSSYNIYRNGTLLTTSSINSYSDSSLSFNTTYTYYVVAVDSSNNLSGNSTTASVTTGVFTTATLGITVSSSSVDDNNNNHLTCAQFTMPSGQSGTASSFSVYIGSPVASDLWAGAIYADSANLPGAFIASTAQTTVSNSNPTSISGVTSYLNTAAIAATLSANTNYWLCYNTNSSSINNDQTMVTGTGPHHWMAQSFGTWPGTFASDGNSTSQYAVYLTYNISGGGDTVAPAAPSGLTVQ